MSDYVIVETNGVPDVITVDDGSIVVTEAPSTVEIITEGIQGPPGVSGSSITEARDADMSGLIDGAVLVYKSLNQKWTAMTTLESQNMDAGEF